MPEAFLNELEPWLRGLPFSLTVCDEKGTILYMNDRAGRSFESQGGKALVGSNILDCHPEPARTRLREIMEKQERNVYTTERGQISNLPPHLTPGKISNLPPIPSLGTRRLIFQSPWYRDGVYAGFFELILPLPESMPHFIREA